MHRYVLAFALATGMLLFTAGIPAAPKIQPLPGTPGSGLPVELRRIMDESREVAFPPIHPDLESTINSFVQLGLDKAEHIRVLEVLRQTRGRHGDPAALMRAFETADLDALLTHEQIAGEIRFLFALMRHGYDGYLYFGGDSVFLPIRDAMLERLSDMPDPLPVSSYLNDIIEPALRGVIADNHFRIHSTTFRAPAYVPYMNGEFTLRRDGNAFVTVINGDAHRVLEVAPAEPLIGRQSPGNAGRAKVPSSGILPTLTADGEPAWAFGLVAAETLRGSMEIGVLFENIASGEKYSRALSLHRLAPVSPRPRYPEFALREMGGIAVLENRSLMNFSPSKEEAFLRSARELRDRPVLVMDLRGHAGGNIRHPGSWLGMFTGQGEPSPSLLFAGSNLQRSQVALELLNFFVPLHLSVSDSIRALLMEIEPRFVMLEDPGAPLPESLRWRFTTSVPWIPPRVPIPNENLVIVLTDKNTGSAGDLFVGYLRQLENVLVVGTNTAGTFLTGGVGRTILPHSGLALVLGTRLNLRHDLSQFEGLGFMPDLWVPPGESLERVLRFVERYGLASCPLVR